MNLPPYTSFPELSSGKIRLREIRPEDIPNLLEILTYDGKSAETLEEGTRIVERIHQNYLDGNSINWVIESLETYDPVGFIGYYRGFENETGEIGFILKEAFRGLGFMSPSLAAAVEFGLKQMELREIHAFTKPDNEKSIAVLKRNGFVSDIELDGDYLKFVYSQQI